MPIFKRGFEELTYVFLPVLVAISAQCRSFGLKSSCMGSGGERSGAGGERRERRGAAGADGVRASGACVPTGGKLSLETTKQII